MAANEETIDCRIPLWAASITELNRGAIGSEVRYACDATSPLKALVTSWQWNRIHQFAAAICLEPSGSITPIFPLQNPEYHPRPFGSTPMKRTLVFRVGSAYSTNCSVFGSNRPILFPTVSQYQMLPLWRSTTRPYGEAFGVRG